LSSSTWCTRSGHHLTREARLRKFPQSLARIVSNELSVTVGRRASLREFFGQSEIRYRYAEFDRSQIYLEALPALVSGRVQLPDSKRLVTQLSALECKTSSSGGDRVNHADGGANHDDLANATCGAIVEALSKKNRAMIVSPRAVEIARISPRQWALQRSLVKPST
jgi:hypothetical protein